MSQTVTVEDLQQKLYEKLKPSGWGDKLKTFVLSQDFESIIKTLMKESSEGRRFVPEMRYIFGAFEACPYKDVKVVWFGQDPYPYFGVPDGIAFSCSRTGKVEKSLQYMFKEIEDTVYPTEGYEWNPDLSRWSKQGILMLNTGFTVAVEKPGSHLELWRPFITFLLDMLRSYNPGLIYVFSGQKAADLVNLLEEKDEPFTLYSTHPASAAYRKDAKWDSDNLFNKISNLVKKHYNYDIKW